MLLRRREYSDLYKKDENMKRDEGDEQNIHRHLVLVAKDPPMSSPIANENAQALMDNQNNRLDVNR